jgi:hypothetical protein
MATRVNTGGFELSALPGYADEVAGPSYRSGAVRLPPRSVRSVTFAPGPRGHLLPVSPQHGGFHAQTSTSAPGAVYGTHPTMHTMWQSSSADVAPAPNFAEEPAPPGVDDTFVQPLLPMGVTAGPAETDPPASMQWQPPPAMSAAPAAAQEAIRPSVLASKRYSAHGDEAPQCSLSAGLRDYSSVLPSGDLVDMLIDPLEAGFADPPQGTSWWQAL